MRISQRLLLRHSLLIAILLPLTPLFAQPRAILADGSGPWQTAQWSFTVSQFSSLLTDAGYTVTIVSPVDLPSLIPRPGTLVAVPSLASLPFATFTAITAHVTVGGSLMASGGAPFSDALYLTPNGQWLDFAAYQQAVGSPPPQGPFTPPSITTISPASQEQYINSAGLQVPVARNRGIFSMSYSSYRVIGDLLAPAATVVVGPGVVVWLPWPQLFDPLRAQLVSALASSSSGLHFSSAGADQLVWLPGETITGQANIVNFAPSAVEASLQWSIVSASGITPQPTVSLSLTAYEYTSPRLTIGSLPLGDYTLSFRLMVGNEEMDRIDSPVRVLDPTLTRQPDQKIKVVNGGFSTAAGQHVFLRGVNYWPRYIAGISVGDFNSQSWLDAGQYDPDLVEADLAEIAALGFNLVNIQFTDYASRWAEEGRSLIDFLERCRTHGIWARIFLGATVLNGAYNNQLSPTLDNYLQSAYLPGNDRVFAYEILWEPMIGMQTTGGAGEEIGGVVTGVNTGRTVLDPDWQSWVNDRYGSLANAQQAWSFTAPLDATGQLTNPLDDQIENDGPWRIMVAAYRRFLEDYLGWNIGVIARHIHLTDPDTLLTYRNWTTMNQAHNANTGYDIGTGAAHLDFFSPERYSPVLLWPDDRPWGLVTAYSRYRTGGKPVQWTEFGADVSTIDGSSTSQATQGSICDTMMRQVADDGSNAASVWWWPGGYSPGLTGAGSDFGIINPDGSPRPCAADLQQWNATFAAAAPDLTSDPPTTIAVDRDADARGSYGLFLSYQNNYLQARQAGMSVVLTDQGTGTDTSTMPLVQVGDVLYTGTGPLKFADAEFAGIQVVCPALNVTVENGSSVPVPPGATCQITPTLVNTGEAQWLPGSASKGGVILQTSAGNLSLTAPLPSLQRTAIGTLNFTMGQSTIALTGRAQIQGVGGFGQALNLTLTVDPNSGGGCPISLSSNGPVSVPSAGATGTVNITAPSTCGWTASWSETWLILNPAAGSGNGSVTYTIAPNYGPSRQTTITIAGHPFTVTEAAVSTPAFPSAPTSSAASLNFGNQTIGVSTAAQTVTIANPGTSALNLSPVAIGGLNNGDFAQTNNCGAALAAAATCTVQVVFTPSDAGMRTASLFVGGSVSGGPLAIGLSGAGVATGPTPAVQAIVDAWGYTPGIAPGLWVTIGGTSLGGPPQSWTVPGTQLPVTVGDVSVTFNGLPAAESYVSGPQVNALVPAGVTPGPVQVVVQAYGLNGSAFNVTATATHPAVYALPTADGSTFFVTAVLTGTATLIGNSAVDPRVLRAAYPGDTLDLYVIGLGATLDPLDFITNQVFAGAFPLAAQVTATVGGEPANVLFSGLTSPGLYLVRIVVPSDLAAGPQLLQVTAGGVPTRPSLVLQVATPPHG